MLNFKIQILVLKSKLIQFFFSSYIENEMARRGVTQELIDDTRSQTERQMLSDLVAWQATGGDMEV